jgi:hypothetical protein
MCLLLGQWAFKMAMYRKRGPRVARRWWWRDGEVRGDWMLEMVLIKAIRGFLGTLVIR